MKQFRLNEVQMFRHADGNHPTIASFTANEVTIAAVGGKITMSLEAAVAVARYILDNVSSTQI